MAIDQPNRELLGESATRNHFHKLPSGNSKRNFGTIAAVLATQCVLEVIVGYLFVLFFKE